MKTPPIRGVTRFGSQSVTARSILVAALAMTVFLPWLPAQEKKQHGGDEISTSAFLYTNPDPNAGGGIRGEVINPSMPLSGAFALPPSEPRFVYKGEITGENKRSFIVRGLPVEKYDLILVFDRKFYEGLNLHRGENTLTGEDRKGIEKILSESEPFFNVKVIHRIEGVSDPGHGYARGICSFLRTRESTSLAGTVYTDHRRSLKLLLVQDVGPGWQVERTREIFVAQIKAGKNVYEHVYRKTLGGIRVLDKIKNLGQINLTSH